MRRCKACKAWCRRRLCPACRVAAGRGSTPGVRVLSAFAAGADPGREGRVAEYARRHESLTSAGENPTGSIFEA